MQHKSSRKKQLRLDKHRAVRDVTERASVQRPRNMPAGCLAVRLCLISLGSTIFVEPLTAVRAQLLSDSSKVVT